MRHNHNLALRQFRMIIIELINELRKGGAVFADRPPGIIHITVNLELALHADLVEPTIRVVAPGVPVIQGILLLIPTHAVNKDERYSAIR